MIIEFGNYRVVPHNDLCWRVERWRMTEPRGAKAGVEPEEKWIDLGRYYSTLEGALKFAYEHGLLNAVDGEYGLKEALEEARRIERAISKAAKEAAR